MRRNLQFVVVGLLALLLAAGVMAQDATEEAADGQTEQSCTGDEWGEFLPGLIETVAQLETVDDPLATLLLIQAHIGSMRSACTGGVWSSEEYGTSSSVIGPIIFTGSLYRATLTSHAASVRITTLEGDCGMSGIGATGDSPDGVAESEVLWEFENCVAYFQVSPSGNTWTLSVEKLK